MRNGFINRPGIRERLSPYWLFLIISIFLSKPIAASGATMIDLTQPNEHQSWRATNDNVMGGISLGQLTYGDQSSKFSGELSLANNGGFSSVNRTVETLRLDVEQVELTFLGDGRSYQLRLSTLKDGYRFNYKHDFSTVKGQLLKKEFALKDFQAVFRGRLLSDAPILSAEDVKQVGLLIADKKAGPFALHLYQIRFLSVQDIE
ncbi:CIA30 family protein [Vibrio sp. HN007]|uniref:CIA30 family protein n=1 Tax=Vibrio iocasae TaxID=3098914 RepID=UPI0035D3F88C